MKWMKQPLKDDFWVVVFDIISVNVPYFLALVLRSIVGQVTHQFSGWLSLYFSAFYRFAPYYTIACLIVFYLFRLYGGLWRYAGIGDMNRVIGASIVTCVIQVLLSILPIYNLPYNRMPITYYVLGAAMQFVMVSTSRFAYRIAVIEKRRADKKTSNALVIGVGELGQQTIRVLEDGVFFKLSCAVDPENKTVGKLIDGVPIYGLYQLEDLIARYDISCVFLAAPYMKEATKADIKAICEKKQIEIRDYSSFLNFTEQSDQFTVMENVVKGPDATRGERSIPFSPPDISEAEIGEVVDALNSGWITTGPRTKLLERRLAAFIETGKADIDTETADKRWNARVVCLNSATAAEELNLRVLGIGAGDEVIVPAYTYTASASAAVHCGATVKFIDIQKDGDPVTHMPELDYDALEAAITERTKAIILVDLGGIVCNYEKAFAIAERKKSLFRPVESDGTQLGDLSSRIQHALGRVAIVADCAHSLGASREFNGVKKHCGEIADFTSFSFHAVKNFTTAEGGASTWRTIDGIDNAEIYTMYQRLSLHGQSKDALAKTKVGAWEYDIIGPWYKCNMTDIMAAIGLRQLDRYPGLLDRRKQMVRKYDAVCDKLGLFHLHHHIDGMDSSNHLYLIRVPGIDEAVRNEIIEKMAEHGVATNVHYKPLPMMTAYGSDCSNYPNAYDYYRNVITLPLHTLLSDEDVAYVCQALTEVVKEIRGKNV